jgi:hypothetical protein
MVFNKNANNFNDNNSNDSNNLNNNDNSTPGFVVNRPRPLRLMNQTVDSDLDSEPETNGISIPKSNEIQESYDTDDINDYIPVPNSNSTSPPLPQLDSDDTQSE